MPRVKRGSARRNKRKKVLKLTKGFFLGKSSEHFRQVQNVTAANMALVRTRMDEVLYMGTNVATVVDSRVNELWKK